MSEAPSNKEVNRINVPQIYASTFNVGHTSNEFSFLMGLMGHGLQNDNLIGINTPVAALYVSPQSAKDLYLLLKGNIEKYEARFGPIETDFMRGDVGSNA